MGNGQNSTSCSVGVRSYTRRLAISRASIALFGGVLHRMCSNMVSVSVDLTVEDQEAGQQELLENLEAELRQVTLHALGAMHRLRKAVHAHGGAKSGLTHTTDREEDQCTGGTAAAPARTAGDTAAHFAARGSAEGRLAGQVFCVLELKQIILVFVVAALLHRSGVATCIGRHPLQHQVRHFVQGAFPWDAEVVQIKDETFGLRSGFRPLQNEIINCTMSGRDCLCLLPSSGASTR